MTEHEANPPQTIVRVGVGIVHFLAWIGAGETACSGAAAIVWDLERESKAHAGSAHFSDVLTKRAFNFRFVSDRPTHVWRLYALDHEDDEVYILRCSRCGLVWTH